MERKINFLVNLRCLYSNGNKPSYVSVIDDIITSLQQGDKYRQMWEELDDFIGYSDYEILQKMEELKQKYFPEKEIK